MAVSAVRSRDPRSRDEAGGAGSPSTAQRRSRTSASASHGLVQRGSCELVATSTRRLLRTTRVGTPRVPVEVCWSSELPETLAVVEKHVGRAGGESHAFAAPILPFVQRTNRGGQMTRCGAAPGGPVERSPAGRSRAPVVGKPRGVQLHTIVGLEGGRTVNLGDRPLSGVE